jgi:hypothetical protein
MKLVALALGLLFFWGGVAGAAEEPKVLAKVNPLPVALDRDFEFRKTKLYFLSDKPLTQKGPRAAIPSKPGKLGSTAPSTKSVTLQDASITFERQYRLFGAVTGLDQHQRFGDYFDFFWRAKRPADLTVRLEYRQEKLHSFVQAQEISYPSARGNHKTEFKVVGDDYFDDGRVIAWRCVLIENGRIVAENRSYMWE